jgi:hypothetical protein
MFAEATAEAQQELGIAEPAAEPAPAPEPAKEETPAETPAPETPVEEPKAEEPKEEDLGLSAEQLEAIEKNPELLAVYKSMQRGLTKKSQTYSETIKSYEEKAKLADFIESNPEKALEILAEKAGRSLAPQEPPKPESDDPTEKLAQLWKEALGPEAGEKFFPLLKQSFETLHQQNIAPVMQTQEQLQMAAQERAVAASVAQFQANVRERGGAYDDDIQADMAKAMARLQPAEGSDMQEYLGALYNTVMYDRYVQGNTRAALERLQRAKNETEPTVSARTPEEAPRGITADMTEKEAMEEAVALAELEARGRG